MHGSSEVSRVKATGRSGYISGSGCAGSTAASTQSHPESKFRAVTEWQICCAVAESHPATEGDKNRAAKTELFEEGKARKKTF